MQIPDYIRKPGRYIGNEINIVRKDPAKVNLRFLLSYPDIYEIGMSNLSLKILYEIINNVGEYAAERVFAPAFDMAKYLTESGNKLKSLESETEFDKFDLIGFTLQYELCITNLLNILHLGGIPALKKERSEKDPIIVAGGPILSNPEPYTDFIDIFVIGEAEELIIKICKVTAAGRKSHKSRRQIIDELSELEGVYDPEKFKIEYTDNGRIKGISKGSVKRVYVKDLDSVAFPVKPVVPNLNAVFNRAIVEISRGCTRGCRFCSAGFFYRPRRERSIGNIRKIASEIIKNTGYEEISLLSLSSSDYSCLPELLDALNRELEDKKVSLSLPSLRIDNFTLGVAKKIKNIRKSGLTFALETADENLRFYMNKDITNSQFLEIIGRVSAEGWRNIKLYIMFGFLEYAELSPRPDEVDLLYELVSQALNRTGGRMKITLHLSPFIPKPQTPFQWLGFQNVEILKEKIAQFKSEIRFKNVELRWQNIEMSFWESVISRGDRKIGSAIYRAWQLGAGFDGWDEMFKPDIWQKAFEESGLDPKFYSGRSISFEEILPWSHIDLGYSEGFLKEELEKSRKMKITDDCRKSSCLGCGMKCDKQDAYSKQEIKENELPEKEVMAPVDKFYQETKYKLKFGFTKLGSMKYISHLDLIGIFSRALRMSNLPVYYSKGFNPHPKIIFGRALALGIESSDEVCEIWFSKPVSDDDFRESMNKFLPEGIRVK